MNDDFKVLIKVAGKNTWSVNGHVFLFNEILKNLKRGSTSSSEVGKLPVSNWSVLDWPALIGFLGW